jgi:hypothetical protein
MASIREKKRSRSGYDSRVFDGVNILPEYLKGNSRDTLVVRRLKRPNLKSVLNQGLKTYKMEFDERVIGFHMTPAVVAKGHDKDEAIMPFWRYVS